MKNHLVLIDLQKTFLKNGELSIPNSTPCCQGSANFIKQKDPEISNIWISMDSHAPSRYQIFYPDWFVNEAGQSPKPYSTIKYSDLANGIWSVRFPAYDAYTKNYLWSIESAGKVHHIWPCHATLNTNTWELEDGLEKALRLWEYDNGPVYRIYKGTNPLVEQYSIFEAEDGSGFNHSLIDMISSADRIFWGGIASNICFAASLRSYAKISSLKNSIILTDLIAPTEGGEVAETEFLDEMIRLGAKVSKSTEVLKD